MYESELSDLVVKYYDVAFGTESDKDLAWYLERVEQFGGPVLDLACGTGRLSLKIAEKGHKVVSLDQSAGMLNIFGQKLEKSQVHHSIRIENQSMHHFKLDEQFNLVVCCDAFFHNISVEEELSCLASIHQHLKIGGRLLFNLPYPNCTFIDHAEKSKGTLFSERGRIKLAGGDELLIEHAQSGDRIKQRIMTTNRVSRYTESGELVERGESQWESRYLYPYEAIHLLHRCGFEVERIEGSYEGAELGMGGQIIIQALKTVKA